MTTKRDYYEILSVTKTATEVEIKKSFRRLAMKYHPDRNPGDKKAEEKFKEVREAYDVLSDKQKRASYDQFGHAGVNQQGFGGGAGGFNFEDIFGGFGDVFGDIFGGARGGRGRQTRAQPGSDLRYILSLTLEEAVKGVTKEVEVNTWAACEKCDGSGAKSGTKPETCPECQGSGMMHIQQGFLSIQQPCHKCHGTGQVIKEPCDSCHGQGRIQKAKKLSVVVPAGVDNGDRIRLTGEGEAGLFGGPAGDLYVEIKIKSHAIFTRQGGDLHCEIPISFTTAALGGSVEVPTLDGKANLKIPPETQTGKVFRFRGKGVKSVRGGFTGDMLCRVTIETPVKLTKEQKELLVKLEESMTGSKVDHSPQSLTWVDKAKRFFENLTS